MIFIIYLHIFHSLFNEIISSTETSIIELEKGEIKQIQLEEPISKIIYIVSKNDISGTYTYDIESPYILEISYGKSDNKNKIPDIFEGHYEKVKIIKGYFYSIPVSIKEDNKYTFIKMVYKDNINIFNNKNNNITIHLIENYTGSILSFVLCVAFIEIFIILFFCTCGRKFLTKFCDFRNLDCNKGKKYKKIDEIYELNVIDID